MIVTQFAISVALLGSTIIVFQQNRHLNNLNLGIDKENKIIVNLGEYTSDYPTIRNYFEKIPGINAVTFSSHVPTEDPHGLYTEIENEKGEKIGLEVELNLVDLNYFKTYGIQLVAGENFPRVPLTDSTSFLILSETAAKKFGFSDPDAAIGKKFTQWGKRGKIIGVVKDFNQHSALEVNSAISFQVNPDLFEKMTLSYTSSNISGLLQKLAESWKQATGSKLFDYSFLDELFSKKYLQERRFLIVFSTFSLISILITAIGLLGLTSFITKLRIKEIGIRKSLGASVSSIVILLSKDFLGLVLIAILIGIISGFVVHWL